MDILEVFESIAEYSHKLEALHCLCNKILDHTHPTNTPDGFDVAIAFQNNQVKNYGQVSVKFQDETMRGH